MNFDNGHRQRQGQHNKRGRGRNNRRPGGGGGGQHGGGGNSINRVYESNGPDVKVRGTAQTVAEKYMQLGRDAHSAGDNVMAESYYQFAEHYFRVLQSVQPPGQLAPQLLRRPGEDSEEEVEGGEGDEATPAGEGSADGGEMAAQAGGDDGDGASAVEAGQPGSPGMRQERPRDQDGRDNNRERFRPRWQQRRNERGPEGGRDQVQVGDRQTAEGDDVSQPVHRDAEPQAEADGNWEAPSFLKRPVAAAAADTGSAPVDEPRQPRQRRSRPVAEEAAPTTTNDE